jgi:hypothetical protein
MAAQIGGYAAAGARATQRGGKHQAVRGAARAARRCEGP